MKIRETASDGYRQALATHQAARPRYTLTRCAIHARSDVRINARFVSLLAGTNARAAVGEHSGRLHGVEILLAPWAAFSMFGLCREVCGAVQRRSLQRQQTVYEIPVSPLSTTDEVLGKLQVLEALTDISDPRTRAVVALTLDGYTQEEIQQLLDVTSVRAVEGLLYRWRKKAQRPEGGERHG